MEERSEPQRPASLAPTSARPQNLRAVAASEHRLRWPYRTAGSNGNIGWPLLIVRLRSEDKSLIALRKRRFEHITLAQRSSQWPKDEILTDQARKLAGKKRVIP